MKDFNTHKFLKILDDKKIKYHYEGKWLVVDGDEYGGAVVVNEDITSLPDYIKFNSRGDVYLWNNNLPSLPDHIEFNNKGDVDISDNNLTSLPDEI